MSSAHERELIVDHALASEDNLGIALMIGASYEELCGRLIVNFVEAVARSLVIGLGDNWRVTTVRDPVEAVAAGASPLAAQYLSHPADFEIRLESEEPRFPKWPYLVVGSGSRTPLAEDLRAELKAAIDAAFVKGRVGDPSVWYRYLDKPHHEWGSEESFVRLYRKDDAVAYLVSQISGLARAVEESLKSTASSRETK